MIKLIATDLDGTLVDSGSRNIDPAYFDVIKKLTDKGITFVVASGRQEESIRKTFAPMLDRIYMISNNGAVFGTADGEMWSKVIPLDKIKSITEELLKFDGCTTFLSNSDSLFYFPGIPEHVYKYASEGYGFTLKPFISYEELPPINKICVYRDTWRRNAAVIANADGASSSTGNSSAQFSGTSNTSPSYDDESDILTDPGTASALDGIRDKMLAGAIPPHPALALRGKHDGIETYVAGDEWVDFMPGGISKGNALLSLQEKLGITKEETIVFGDQENDISMFKCAGKSYAVANASPSALEAADEVIPAYTELGVLRELEKMV